MRICFFGDSLVNGTGDDDGLGWGKAQDHTVTLYRISAPYARGCQIDSGGIDVVSTPKEGFRWDH
jgi:hypothetical protein